MDGLLSGSAAPAPTGLRPEREDCRQTDIALGKLCIGSPTQSESRENFSGYKKSRLEPI